MGGVRPNINAAFDAIGVHDEDQQPFKQRRNLQDDPMAINAVQEQMSFMAVRSTDSN